MPKDKKKKMNEEDGMEEEEKENSQHTGTKDKKMNSASDADENSIGQFLTGLRDKFAGVFQLRSNKELSDLDTRRALEAALLAEDENNFFDIFAVFEGTFVYAKGFEGTLLSRGYSIAEDGDITINSDEVKVRPITEFVPVKSKEEKAMSTNKEKIDELIANSATQFSEDDRAWLEGQDEDVLNKLSPVANSDGSDESDTTQEIKDNEGTDDGSDDAEVTANSAQTPEEFIDGAPAEMQEVLKEGLRMQRESKAKIVKELIANKRCSFNEEELKGKDLDELRKLSALANTPSYAGQAGGEVKANADGKEDDQGFTPAPLVFEANKPAANE